jgi:peptidoglycan/LPS O-acetylase OafA/YrhL
LSGEKKYVSEQAREAYWKQLGSLRALAVFGVLYSHWFDNHVVPWGIMGVRLFFVLSGFLITGILLKGRELPVSAGGSARRLFLWNFYGRRFLRIFTLYYAVLILAACINPAHRRDMWWFFTYTENILFAWEGEAREMPHFWSLAVEEQFYLVWPWLILFTPRRLLLPLILFAVFLGPLSRAVTVYGFGAGRFVATCQPLGCCDTLGSGALLAFSFLEWKQTGRRLRGALWGGLLCGGVSLLVLLVSPLSSEADVVGGDLAMAGFLFGIVGFAATGVGGWAGSVLNWIVLRTIGKISYGIYVIHMFAPGQVAKVYSMLGLAPTGEGFLLASFAFTLVASFVSWHLLEAPIVRLKHYFKYPTSPSTAVVDKPLST